MKAFTREQKSAAFEWLRKRALKGSLPAVVMLKEIKELYDYRCRDGIRITPKGMRMLRRAK